MASRADRVPHVVQAVEHRDEVVAAAGKGRGWSNLELGLILQPGVLGLLAREFDRLTVVVETGESGTRVGLRHEPSRCAKAAAHVSDLPADAQLGLHAIERGQPRGHEVRVVAGAEEALASSGHTRVVLVPSVARTTPERRFDVRACFQRGRSQLERATYEGR